VAKLFSGLLLGGSSLCLISAVILALTIRSLDLQIFDIYFVVLPKYLLFAGAGLLLVALVVWKLIGPH